MAKFLVKVRYTYVGVKGLIRGGGSSRRAAVEEMVGDLGGRVDVFYFAFGDTDAYMIVDIPDNVTAAAVALAVTASGAVGCETVVLLTPEEIDAASKMSVDYHPPGD
jgi:uncharacterized protein with GYD domain